MMTDAQSENAQETPAARAAGEAYPETAESLVAKLVSQTGGLAADAGAVPKPQVIKVLDKPLVHLIQVPFVNISTSETNVYVIQDAGEALIVDTGAPSDEGERVLRAALDGLGVDPGAASYFLTHLHLDHAGLIDRMVPQGAAIYLNEIDFDYMGLSVASDFWPLVEAQISAEDFSNEATRTFSRYGMGICSFDPEGRNLHFVGEGDQIRVGNAVFTVVDTAGHTPGHMSLFHEESGLLFVGDHALFTISPSLGLRPGVADTMGIYLKNLRKLLDMPISQMLVAHGDLRDGWRERVEWMVGHHERRAKRALDYAVAHPGASGQEIIRNMKWNVPVPWDEVSDAQKWCIVESGIVVLNHLAAEGTLVRTQDGTGRYHYHAR